MYGVVCVLLLTGAAFLTVLHFRDPASPRLTWLEGILFGLGSITLPVLHLLLPLTLPADDGEFSAWAVDAWEVYLRYAVPVLSVLFGITFLCAFLALWEKKYRAVLWIRLRSVCVLASSAAVLALAAFFGAMSRTDAFPLETWIQIAGAAGVLVLRGMYLAEFLWRRKYSAVGTRRDNVTTG